MVRDKIQATLCRKLHAVKERHSAYKNKEKTIDDKTEIKKLGSISYVRAMFVDYNPFRKETFVDINCEAV